MFKIILFMYSKFSKRQNWSIPVFRIGTSYFFSGDHLPPSRHIQFSWNHVKYTVDSFVQAWLHHIWLNTKTIDAYGNHDDGEHGLRSWNFDFYFFFFWLVSKFVQNNFRSIFNEWIYTVDCPHIEYQFK